jgi:predicted ATPase/class 3 adenylate cyclase
MEPYSFGHWLRLKRKALDLTREGLADRVGYSAETIRKIETEERRPSAQLVDQLAALFEIPENQRRDFLRFARGDWQAAPSGNVESSPWLATRSREQDDPHKQNLPAGTVTFLFTDIEGSTKLSQQYPEALPALLARHHEILNECVKTHAGYAFQIVGDSFAVAFHSALDALNAALAAQQSLHNEAWSPAPIKVRMGIHTGTAHLNDPSAPTVYSAYATIALTQRIMSAGHGGQILLSGATRELVRDALPTDSELQDLGAKRLKDSLHPEHIYQLNIAGLPSSFPSLKTLASFLNNLPAQLTTFIGREEEIAEIKKELASHRLVTLTGPGGIGKTRLSVQVAVHLLETFSDGVWFVELAPLTDPDLIPQTIHTTLGLVEPSGKNILQMLMDFLRDKKTLLILDNCEHLVEACAQLTHTLLSHSLSLKILASSREALGVAGELAWPVPSLSLPDPKKIPELEQMTQYEAVHLFLDRASLANPHFLMTEDNAPAIAQICYRLDGIPLAIELAAARVRGLSVEQIASRLDDRFHLLTSGARTVLPRHQTLHALIDWSHDLLSESESALLRRLSVFTGGWTLEAAESVCAGDGLESDQILEVLLHLVDKSLVVAKAEGTEPRYYMLETIRQYAREKLWAAREGERLRQRHLAYFVDLAERAEPNLRAFDMMRWLDDLEDELDNIRLALAWALESDIEAQLRLASALLWFWHIRGHRNEGIAWWERGLSIETRERGDQPFTLSRALIRGKALNAIGLEITISFELDRAKTYLEESAALFGELGPAGKHGRAYALTWLAGDNSQSRSIQEQNLTVFRELGDKFGTGDCLMFLHQEARNNHDYERAITLAEEQLALRREIGDHDGAATALFQLGHVAFLQHDFRRAVLLLEEGLSLFRAVGNKWALGIGLSNLGDVFLWQRDYEQATKIYEEALAFARDISDSFLITFNSYNLGAIAWFQGDYARADQIIAESLAVFRDYDMDWVTASCIHTLGDIALAQGDEQRAIQWYETELAFGQEKQLEISLMFALNGLGKAAWVQGKYEVATKRFEEALRMSEKAGPKTAMLLALYGLGRVALSQRDYDSAGEFLTQASEIRLAETSEIRLPETNELFTWIWLKTYGVATDYPLEAFAVLAAAQNQMERAARLFGAVESLYASIHFEMSAKERTEHDHAIASARAALGDEAFAAAWAEGRLMTMEQAIAFALK